MKAVDAALNLSTFITLFDYGYRDGYELAPLLDLETSKLEFEGRAAWRGEISERPAEQVEGQAHGRARRLGVVARALVAHERVLGVELVPVEAARPPSLSAW